MKQLFRTSLLSLALLVVAGCASHSNSGTRPAIIGRGNGLAAGALYRTGETKVLAADAAAAPSCTSRAVTTTEVVRQPAVVATPYDAAYTYALQDVSKGVSGYPAARTVEVAYSEFVERWTVNRCGDRVQYLVTFRPDGTVLVAPEK